MKLPREFYIPKQYSARIVFKNVNAEAYLYENERGVCAVGFSGKRSKPDLHYRFRDTEQRNNRIREWIKGLEAHQELKAKRRQERQHNNLKVGDILRSTWGYEQTNVDFYEVVGMSGKQSVIIREIGQISEDTGWLQGSCVPAPGSYIGEPMRKRVQYGDSVRIASYALASKVEPTMVAGKPIYGATSWSAYH